MSSSIFGQSQTSSAQQAAQAIKQAANGDPKGLYARLYQMNPQFRAFADSMRGKTPEQAFREHGLDYSQYRNLF